MKRLLLLVLFCPALSVTGVQPGQQGSYDVLTARDRQPPNFGNVRIKRGPDETVGGLAHGWWQIEARTEPGDERPPLFALRILTPDDLLSGLDDEVRIERYQLRLPETDECLEYCDRHTGRALLPAWTGFTRQFLPCRAPGSRSRSGLPETCEFLGQILSLRHDATNAPWPAWPDAKRLTLDRELLVGTSRPFKDREGRRLPQQPQRQDYSYTPFTAGDYRVMIEAGVNLFTIKPDQEPYVRGEPVFYHRAGGGKPPLRFPADLYRANYLGPVMFLDEPSILMVGDTNIHRTLRYFTDAAALIETRTRITYESEGSYGMGQLAKSLAGQGANLGGMSLRQADFPSWETLHDTAFYQMRGGGMGIVHEGRYQQANFDAAVERFTGVKRRHSPEELLRYHYAFLRGGARPFNKFWGTAIYGQCDTNLAPLALTLAYDMGARYLWFWTSDHDHHVPWPEQIALVRHLRAHAVAHPRPSIVTNPPRREAAIVIPFGYFLSLDNLWWVRVMDKEGKNEASQKYRRLMQRALAAVHDCFDRNVDFDITVDAGRDLSSYRKIIRISDD